jgi:hypothetical protein
MSRKQAIVASLLLVGCIAMPLAQRAPAQSDAGWVTLLDGSNMGDWNRVGEANWRMQDGAVMADKKTGENPAYLVSKNSYKDFQIRAEVWVDTAANSGIFIRCSDPQKISSKDCYEVNIFDTRPDPSYGTGAIVNVAKVDPMPKAGERWNTLEITAQGPHLVVVLNGAKTADAQDSKLPNGPFALQYGAGVVKWRKVQIKQM